MFEHLNVALAPIALFYLLCAVISVIGNGIMIIIFFKKKSFQSPCHYMITLSCLSDFLHLSGHFIFNFQLFTGISSSQATCYFLMIGTSIGKCLSSPLILVMGIDRFIACKSPVIYRALMERQKLYIFVQLIFPTFYATFFMISGFIQRENKKIITCSVPQAFAGSAFEYFNTSGIVINLLIVIIYFLTFMKLRTYSGGKNMKIVFKSILWTVIFVIVGWSSVTIANQFAIFANNAQTRQLIAIHAGIGVNLASCSNIFVFYFINSEYREAIRSLFGLKVVCRVKSVSGALSGINGSTHKINTTI